MRKIGCRKQRFCTTAVPSSQRVVTEAATDKAIKGSVIMNPRAIAWTDHRLWYPIASSI